MNPLRVTVSQVAAAAACPRIAWFDARSGTTTRLWKTDESGGSVTALGSLFHRTVEKFHDLARSHRVVADCVAVSRTWDELLHGLMGLIYSRALAQDQLFRADGPQQQAFIAALRQYIAELADILDYGRRQAMDPTEMVQQLFGDGRRKVDVTFPVGPGEEALHVVGELDHVFFDFRRQRRRIIDFKLTPKDQSAADLHQVALYALMHHRQHGTQADAALLYLHPEREMVEQSWEQIEADQPRMYDLLASLGQWLAYEPATRAGLQPPGQPERCAVCPWDRDCDAKLGPRTAGKWLTVWSDSPSAAPSLTPPEPPPEAIPDESPPPRGAASDPDAPAPRGHGQSGMILLGTNESGEPIGVPLQGLKRHATIVGAAGSGKTWLAKVFVEEVIRARVPVVAIDPQGDLVQMLRPRAAEEIAPEIRPAYDEFHARVETRVWTPGSGIGVHLTINPLRTSAAADLADATGTSADEHRELMSTLAANLVALASIGGETDSQQTLVLHLIERLAASGETIDLRRMIEAIRDPAAFGIDDPDAFIRKSEREKLARKLNNMLLGTARNMFVGGAPLDVDRLLQPVESDRVPLNVIYLNHLVDDDQKQFFVAALAGEIYRWMITSAGGGDPRLLLFLDEARDYLPSGGRKPPAKEPLRRLFSQGRKYGVCCLICTQSPREVEYKVFSNCSTKIIGGLESQQDVDRVRDWFSVDGLSPAWLGGRKGAERGSFIGRWPDLPDGLDSTDVRSRLLFTHHDGAWSPDQLEREYAADPLREQLSGLSGSGSDNPAPD